jgi:DNA-binding MarR family transcriptional regulator
MHTAATKLAAGGYVKRSRPSADGRESVARITDQGLGLLVKVDQTVSKEERLIGSRLKSAEWTALAMLCERLFLEE